MCQVACMKCVPTGAQYYSGRVDGWVALEEWKLRLTQPPTKLELELGLSLAIFNIIISSSGLSMIQQFPAQLDTRGTIYQKLQSYFLPR